MITGNRDINKLRLTSELEDLPLEELKTVPGLSSSFLFLSFPPFLHHFIISFFSFFIHVFLFKGPYWVGLPQRVSPYEHLMDTICTEEKKTSGFLSFFLFLSFN